MIVIFWSVISGNILPIWTVFSYYEHYFKTHSRNFRRLALSYLCLGRRLIRSFKLALPSGQFPRAFDLLKIVLFKFPPPREKIVSKCPTQFFFRKMQNQRRGLLHIDQASKRRPCRPFFSEPFACESGLFTWSTSIFKKYKTCIPRKDLSLPVQISSHRFKYPHTSQARLKFPTTGHGRWSLSVGCQGGVEASNWSAHKSLQSSQL